MKYDENGDLNESWKILSYFANGGEVVTTGSFMIQNLSSYSVKLLHAASERNSPGDLFAAECFDQLLSTNSLDLVFNVILR